MNATYLDAIATYGGTLISHVALVNGAGTEITGGTYARQPVTWTTANDGLIRPSNDLEFAVPAGGEVAGWRGFSAATGGTGYGGADFSVEVFGSAGTFTLLASQTFIDHDSV